MAPSAAASKGIRLYWQGRYEEALKVFDQAIRENSNDKNLYDSRAAVLEKLDRLTEALKDSKKVIDLAPESWQGYRRAGGIFLRLGKLKASSEMITMAIQRSKASETKRQAELEALREEVLKATKQSQCHFAKLPVEIQIEIFSLVINSSNSRMLALNLVCRHWRDLILNTPKFWRHLVCTNRMPQRIVDAWLERANGVLTSLRVERGFELRDREDAFRKASKDLWSKLEELEVDGDSIYAILPAFVSRLRLRRLVIDASSKISYLEKYFWRDLRSLETSTTHHLAIRVRDGDTILLDRLPFSKLTSLELSGAFEFKPFFELLRRNTMLETLIVTHPPHWGELPTPVDPIDLPYLRRVELFNLFVPGILLRYLRIPSLAAIKVDGSVNHPNVPCIEALVSQDITSLTEIVLDRCTFSYASLISLLRRSDLLETLKLRRCMSREGSTNTVIEALCDRTSVEGENSSPTIVCPRLQHLDVSGSFDLKAGPLVGLVKAHLTASAIGLVEGPSSTFPPSEHSLNLPLPILSLNIDNCDSIDSEALQWLRARVPTVSSKMTIAKRVKRNQ